MAGNLSASVQTLYRNAVLAKLTEFKEKGLKSFAERNVATGGEKVVFYRGVKANVVDGVDTMYGKDPNNIGDLEKFEAYIKEVSTQAKIKDSDMKKTKLDLKSPIVNGMVTAVTNKENAEILNSISQNAAKLNKIDKTGVSIDDKKTVQAIIAAVRMAHAKANCTPDGKKGVAVVMSPEDYADFSTSDYFLNKDYHDAFKGGTNDLPLSFLNAEIIISNSIPNNGNESNGYVYIIPSNTFGYAEWQDGIHPVAEFHETDGRRWHLQIVKSLGVVTIEPESITQITFRTNHGTDI